MGNAIGYSCMLLRGNGVYYHRKVVPAALRAIVGRREILVSLRTKDKELAKSRLHAAALEADRELAAARKKHALIRQTPDRLAEQWKRRALASDLEWRADAPRRNEGAVEAELDLLDSLIADTRQALAENDLGTVAGMVRELLAEHGLPELPAEATTKLARGLLTARLDALRIARRRASGDFTGDTPERLEENSRSDEDNPPLSVVLDKWKHERHVPPSTATEWQTVVDRFTSLVGEDLPVRRITRSHVRAFKDGLMRTPARIPRKLRDKPFSEVLAATKDDGSPRLSVQTVQKLLGALQSLLSWAMKQGYVDHNVAQGLKPERRHQGGEDKRLPYDVADLTTLFSSKVYTDRKAHKPADYWLPLLGLWTGCRLEELGQLLVADVKDEDGIAYLDIRGGDGKRVKSAASARRVPIHPELVRLGFLDFVKGAKGPRLFHELRHDTRGKLTPRWGKWYSSYTRSLGLRDSRKVFHSFRHTFASACRRAEVPLPVQEALMGHSSGRVSARYGSGHPLRVLADAMRKVSYPGVKLPD